MKKSILLILGVFGTSLSFATDYDGIINVRFVLGTAFLGMTCTNSQAKENNLTIGQYGFSCGTVIGVGYNADWYLKKGDIICIHVFGFAKPTNFLWKLMDTNNSSISLWGTDNYPKMSYDSNLSYLGEYDSQKCYY